MTSQLPRFRCLFSAATTKNGAAVMSLRSFLFRDDFSDLQRVSFNQFSVFARINTLLVYATGTLLHPYQHFVKFLTHIAISF